MSQALLRQRRTCRAAVWVAMLLVASATSAYAQVRPGNGLRHDQGFAGRGGPWRDGHRDRDADTADALDRHRRQRVLHIPEPSARSLRHLRRAAGLQERDPHRRAGRCGVGAEPRVRPRDWRADRDRHGDLRGDAAANRRRRPEDGRSEGHRAPVVQRPQSDWRARAQGRRDRWQLQQRRGHVAHRRRLQHQRWSLGRGGRLRGRRRCDADPIGRLDDRRAERRHGAGSSGVDRQLHARVRARERRTDPVHLEEREQPLLRQRLVLFQRRQAAGQHLGAQPQPQRDGEFRRRAVRPEAVRVLASADRSPERCSRTSCSSLSRRSGWISSRCRPVPRRCLLLR